MDRKDFRRDGSQTRQQMVFYRNGRKLPQYTKANE